MLSEQQFFKQAIANTFETTLGLEYDIDLLRLLLKHGYIIESDTHLTFLVEKPFNILFKSTIERYGANSDLYDWGAFEIETGVYLGVKFAK